MRTIAAALAVIGSAIVLSSGPAAQAAPSEQSNPQQKPQVSQQMVTVQPGDYLIKVAEANGSTAERVFFANKEIKNPDLIYVNQNLRIPSADEELSPRAIPANETVPQTNVTAPAPVAAAEAAQPAPAACDEATQWVRADNGQCLDKPAAQTPVAAAPQQRAAPVPAPVAASSGSGCDWLRGRLAANGIAAGDIDYAISIASRESGCNPAAVNPTSGACNVFQEYTCGKWGGRSNVDAHIQGANSYAKARYGGWAGAYSFWNANKWW